jgi:hypothetical protein
MCGTEPVRFNVACGSCGDVFTPTLKSALWWKAKKRADMGYLDALRISGVECGCVTPLAHPNASFRVLGYDDLLRGYNIPFDKFTDAVREFRKARRDGEIVYITGVSEAVKSKLVYGH